MLYNSIPVSFPLILATGEKDIANQILRAHVLSLKIIGIGIAAALVFGLLLAIYRTGSDKRKKQVDDFFRRLHGTKR